jgi:hypothetical protein
MSRSDIMKVAFYKGTRPGLQSIFSVVARFCTRSKYSHAEIVFSNGDSASSSYIDNGVRILTGEKRIDFSNGKWDLVEFDPAKFGKTERQILDWFDISEGQPYDLFGMLSCAAPIFGNNDGEYMCSESIAHALGFSDAWRYSPPLLHSVLSQGVYFGDKF